MPPSRRAVAILQGVFGLPHLKSRCRCATCAYEWKQFVYESPDVEPEPPEELLESENDAAAVENVTNRGKTFSSD